MCNQAASVYCMSLGLEVSARHCKRAVLALFWQMDILAPRIAKAAQYLGMASSWPLAWSPSVYCFVQGCAPHHDDAGWQCTLSTPHHRWQRHQARAACNALGDGQDKKAR